MPAPKLNEVDVTANEAVLAAQKLGVAAMVDVGAAAPWPQQDDQDPARMYPTPVRLSDGRWVGTVSAHGEPGRELVVLDGDTRRAIALPKEWDPGASPRISPSGSSVILYVRREQRGLVVEHQLDGSGAWSVIASGYDPAVVSRLNSAENVWEADYAGSDDQVVVCSTTKAGNYLSLFHRMGDGWREISNIKVTTLQVVCKGRFIVCADEKGTQAFGVVGDGVASRLVKLGTLAKLHFFVHPADTRDQLWGHEGVGKNGHVLVCDAEALASKKAKRDKKGTTLALRYPPGRHPAAASHDQMVELFGKSYKDEGIVACGRTPAGHLVASGRGVSFVCHGAEKLALKEAEDFTIRSIHPVEERAIGSDSDSQLVIADLATMQLTTFASTSDVWRSFYATAGDRTFIAIERRNTALDLYADCAGEPLGAPLTTLDLEGATTFQATPGAVFIVRAGKKKGTWKLELWRVADDGSALTHAVDVVLPGVRFAKDNVMTLDRGATVIQTLGEGCCFECPRVT